MRRFLLLLLLVTVLSLVGCADASSPPAGSAPASADTSAPADDPHADIFDGDQLYAAAYVGYEELWDLSFFRDAGLIDGAPPIHHVSGGEYYLIIPRYPDMNLQLFRNRLDDAGSQKTLFYEETNAAPFILCCNVSDIFPDVTVLLTRGEEQTEFTPYISLKDGSVQIGDRGLDLTQNP